MSGAQRLETLTRDEALRLLASMPLGRVVFTHLALPALLPVPHLMDGSRIIIRAWPGSAVTAAVRTGGAVVAYEADLIDPGTYLGWSVTVVGRARTLADDAEYARYRELLRSSVAGAEDGIIAIEADLVDGFRIVGDEE